MTLAALAAFFYGLLTIGGDIIGYLSSKSKVSLVMGGFFGTMVVVGAMVSDRPSAIANIQGQSIGLIVAAVITSLLVIVFVMRWQKIKKLMPAGLMAGLGLLSLLLMLL